MTFVSGTKKHKDKRPKIGTKNEKGKGPEKVYVEDSDSNDEVFDFSFLDFSQETCKPPSNLCNDPFRNFLCDENMLKRGIDGPGDDNNQPGVNKVEHGHLPEVNDKEIGVEFS
ncbi:unnamed protein product [Lactuca virosa]|uniref:Uncharacterized protein n=1 Tax=Lactuca virosa TaxID=75947 RepID=A0AAU9NED8_9ASTR|nr:unnamed protein product [Lactuca virosa]